MFFEMLLNNIRGQTIHACGTQQAFFVCNFFRCYAIKLAMKSSFVLFFKNWLQTLLFVRITPKKRLGIDNGFWRGVQAASKVWVFGSELIVEILLGLLIHLLSLQVSFILFFSINNLFNFIYRILVNLYFLFFVIKRCNKFAFCNPMELRYHFFECRCFSLALVTELDVQVTDWNGELADHWLTPACEYIIVDLAGESWAEQRVDRQWDIERHQRVDRWIRTRSLWFGLQVRQVSAERRGHETLQVEVDKGFFDRQNTWGLQSAEPKNVKMKLELLHFDHFYKVHFV